MTVSVLLATLAICAARRRAPTQFLRSPAIAAPTGALAQFSNTIFGNGLAAVSAGASLAITLRATSR